jgi:hypothetical protein
MKACIDDSDYFLKHLQTHKSSLVYSSKNFESYISRHTPKEEISQHIRDISERYKKQLGVLQNTPAIKLNIRDAADKAELKDFYDVYYHSLSDHYSHPYPRAIELQSVRTPDGKPDEIHCGPTTRHSKHMLFVMAHIMISVIACADRHWKTNIQSKIDKIHRDFLTLQKNEATQNCSHVEK